MMHTYASAPPAPQPGYMGVPGAPDYAALGQPGPSAHAGLYAHDSIRLYPSLLHLAHIRMQAPKQASWVAFDVSCSRLCRQPRHVHYAYMHSCMPDKCMHMMSWGMRKLRAGVHAEQWGHVEHMGMHMQDRGVLCHRERSRRCPSGCGRRCYSVASLPGLCPVLQASAGMLHHMAVQPLRLRNLYQARRCDAGHLKTGVLFDDCWEPVSCASAALSR